MKKLIRSVICIIILSVIYSTGAFAISFGNTSYVLDKNNNKIPIPKMYKTIKVIDYFGNEAGSMQFPEDIFIDSKDNVYIADTGNARVIKTDNNGNLIKIYDNMNEGGFRTPRGVFADDNGDIYVADTDNQKVWWLDKDGKLIKTYEKPKSDMLGDIASFDPNKVAKSKTGYIYIVKGKQFLTIDANNNFKGYVGSNKVKFTFFDFMVRTFATSKQKEKIKKLEPAPYSNFMIADDGMIYATGLDTDNQLKEINTIGNNIFKSKFYGEYFVNDNGVVQLPMFVDLAVNKEGIISVIEQNSKRIYQYGPEGELIAVFGGYGDKMGFFQMPSSIATDSKGRLYILDKDANNIQIMEPTGFTNSIHTAIMYYNDGNYAKARDEWDNVLKVDSNYPLALNGLGKSLYKAEKYKASMDKYYLADVKKGYSDAFDEERHNILRENFVIIFFIIILSFIAIVFVVMKLKKISDKVCMDMYMNIKR